MIQSKTVMKFLWLILLLPQFVFSQEFDSKNNKVSKQENIVKRVAFATNQEFYPLTVLISPYGYLMNSKVWLGDQKCDSIDYLKNFSIGWQNKDSWHSTSSLYRFDTLSVDTIYNVLGTAMCNTKNIEWVYPDQSINVPDLRSTIANEFKYSFLFEQLDLKVESPVVLRVTYPTSTNPFESNLSSLTMELSENSILLKSKLFDISDIFNIIVLQQEEAELNKKHYKSLNRILSKSVFNKNVVCYHLKDSSITDWDFVLEYFNGEKHYTYFLCSSAKSLSNDEDKAIVKNIVDLFLAAKNFNNYYFGIGR